MSLVASVLERSGLPTVTLSVMPDISARLQAPRTLVVPFGLGTPVGPPNQPEVHDRVLGAALALVSETRTPVTRVWSDSP